MAKTIGQQIEDLFLLHALDLALLEVDRVIDLRSQFDNLKKQLVELTVAAELASVNHRSLPIQIENLGQEANELIRDFFKNLSDNSQKFLSDLASVEILFGPTGFNSMLDTDYFKPVGEPDALAGDLIVMGAALPDLFDAQAEALSRKFNQTVSNAARRGFTNEQIASRVRGTQSSRNMRVTEAIADEAGRVPNLTFASPVTSRAQSDAATIMITAMAALSAEAAFGFMAGNPEIFQGIQHKSVLDFVTSQICRTYSDRCWDLQFRPILGNNLPYPGRPPLHYRCRSQHVPILFPAKDLPKELIESLSPENRAALENPAALTSEAGSFKSWFGSVDKSVRISTVGRTFNAAFEQGILSGDGWLNRASGVSINIKEYKQRVEKGFKR